MKLAAEAKYLIPEKLASAPANPIEGRRYYDTTRKVERYYNGTAWVDLDEPVTVATAAPGSNVETGDLWWDSDETAPGITTPLGVTDGGTGATSPATARSSLAVPCIGNSTTVAGPPTAGAWARGDQYLDSANVVWTCVTAGTPGVWKAPPGTELAYNQVTGNVNIVGTSETSQSIILTGTSRTYDGSPILVEFYTPGSYYSGNQQTVFNLLDGVVDIGRIAGCIQGSGYINPIRTIRRLTPTAGAHNYQVGAWVPGGVNQIFSGPGGAQVYSPSFIRVTVA